MADRAGEEKAARLHGSAGKSSRACPSDDLIDDADGLRLPHPAARSPQADAPRDKGHARKHLRGNHLRPREPGPARGTQLAARPASSASPPARRHISVGSLFAEISGKFSKSLVFGCFFPVVFFLLLDWIFFAPFLPPLQGAAGALAALDPEWKTAAVAGLAVLFSGLLYTLNAPIIRFYEGYPWRHSLLGRLLTGVQKRRWSRMVLLGRGLQAVQPDDPERAQNLADLSDRMLRGWYSGFPSQSGSVLPTRLGNTIRSFEDYPRRQYEMSAIPLYPRLLAVIEPGYAATVDDAKSSFDFMINVSFLSALSGAGLLLLGVGSRGLTGLGLVFWLQVAGLLVASSVFYAGSIGQAVTWGNLVRGAFDLYRGKLLEQLGYTQKPADLQAERALWSAISMQMLFGDPPDFSGQPLPRYSDGGTFAIGYPARPLEVSRSASAVEGGGWQTCLRVHNPHDVAVDDVRVTDTLRDGEHYLWSSALMDGQPLEVTGTNPIGIAIGPLAPGERRIVVYRSIK